MGQAPAISINRVSKRFRLYSSPKERLAEAFHPFRKRYHKEFWALDDISFDVNRGEVLGILGRNGSGKSTLLQIVCGVMQQTSGSVLLNGRISALLELGAGFNPEFTGRENVLLNGAIQGLTRQQMLRKIDEIQEFADIGDFFDQPVKLYSSGMFVRVAFAAAIHVDPEILVVDEALSVGDSKFQHRCFQRIRSFVESGKTILVVSHSTDTLLRICNRGVVLDSGKLVKVDGIQHAVDHYHEILYGNNYKDDTPSIKEEENDNFVLDKNLSTLSRDRFDNIIKRRDYNKHEKRMGNNKARIIDFDIIANGQVNPTEIAIHSDCNLYVKILCIQDVDLYVGFAIVSLDGLYVSGTNSKMLGQQLLSLKTGDCVTVKFDWKAHIAGGDYFLNLGCDEMLPDGGAYVDVRRSVAILRFHATPHTVGLVDLEVRAQLASTHPNIVSL